MYSCQHGFRHRLLRRRLRSQSRPPLSRPRPSSTTRWTWPTRMACGAVSIRRIAQDFGVTPMALYWHVKNKDELLAAMGDRMLESLVDAPDVDADRRPRAAARADDPAGRRARPASWLHRAGAGAHPAVRHAVSCWPSGRWTSCEQRGSRCSRARIWPGRPADRDHAGVRAARARRPLSRKDERAAVMAGKRAALAGLPRGPLPASGRMRRRADRLRRRDRLLRRRNRSLPGRSHGAAGTGVGAGPLSGSFAASSTEP